jgi:hypothetical protein
MKFASNFLYKQEPLLGGLMTHAFARFVTRLIFVVLLFAQLGVSQVTRTINVYVPFSFSVGRKTFAAGNYRIRSLGQDRIALDDSRSQLLVYAMTNSVTRQEVPRVPSIEFLHRGEKYTLVRVWNANDSVGHELPQTKSTAVSSKGELAAKIVRIRGTP